MSEILVDNRNELKRTHEFTRLRVKKFRDHQQREVALPNLTLSASYQTCNFFHF